MRGTFVGACLTVTLAACSGNDGSQEPAPKKRGPLYVPYAPTPDPDPFYAQPDPLPDVPPGTILNVREVTFAPQGGTALENAAWQFQVMSKDAHGNPQAAIATVVKPLVAAATSPTPLLSYQFAEDSLGNKCAPSHQVTGSTANPTSQIEALQYLPALQTHGMALVFPDHEGHFSQYATGPLAAFITLDAIRAAVSYEPLELAGTETPIAMWGYSGGALATAWAAQAQPDYAPELNLVGVASGGTPTDLIAASKSFDSGAGNALFALGFSASFGVARAFPDMLPESSLNDKGWAAIESLKDGCVGQTTDGSPPPTGHFVDYVNVPDPFDTPGVNATAPLINLPQPGKAPTANLFVYHAINDQLVPVAGADAMVDAYCAAGTQVHYNRSPNGEHILLAATGAADALNYLVSRFAGGAPVLPAGIVSCN